MQPFITHLQLSYKKTTCLLRCHIQYLPSWWPGPVFTNNVTLRIGGWMAKFLTSDRLRGVIWPLSLRVGSFVKPRPCENYIQSIMRQNLNPLHPSILGWCTKFQSLAPGRRYGCNLKYVILSHLNYSYLEYFLWNCSHVNITECYYGMSTLVHFMAWCHQATSHKLNQCWPCSMNILYRLGN